MIVDSLELPSIKTKQVVGALKALGLGSALLVDKADNLNLSRSTRNLPVAKYLATEGLNVYDVLNYEVLVLSLATAKEIEARLSGGKAEGSVP